MTNPRWAHLAVLVLALVLFACGSVAWAGLCVACRSCGAKFDFSGAAPGSCPTCGYQTVVKETNEVIVTDWARRIPCDGAAHTTPTPTPTPTPKPTVPPVKEQEFPLSGKFEVSQEISPPATYPGTAVDLAKGRVRGAKDLWDRIAHRGVAVHRLHLTVQGIPNKANVDVPVRFEIDPPCVVPKPGRRTYLQDGRAETPFTFKPGEAAGQQGMIFARAYFPASLKLVGGKYEISQKEKSLMARIRPICPMGSSVYFANDLINDATWDNDEIQAQFFHAIEAYGKDKVDSSAYPTATLGWFLAHPAGRVGPFVVQYYTGSEIALHRYILNQGKTKPLTPGELFGRALELNKGDMTNALLTCHNVLRAASRGGEEFTGFTPEELELVSRKTGLSRAELEQKQRVLESCGQQINSEIYECLAELRPGNDNSGAWYHLFATATMSLAVQSDDNVDSALQIPDVGIVQRELLNEVVFAEEYLQSGDIYSDPNEFCMDHAGLELGDSLRTYVAGDRADRIADRFERYGQSLIGKGIPTAVTLRCPVSVTITDRSTGRRFVYDQETQEVKGDLALAYGLRWEGKDFGVIAFLPPGDLEIGVRAVDQGSVEMGVVDLATYKAARFKGLKVNRGDTLALSASRGDMSKPVRDSQGRKIEPEVSVIPDEVIVAEREHARRRAAREHHVRLEDTEESASQPGWQRGPVQPPPEPPVVSPPGATTPVSTPPVSTKDPRIEPTLTLSKKRFAAGDEIRVSFTAPRSFDERAWVGIVPSDIPHGSEEKNDAHDVSSKILKKRTSGELILEAPAKPGVYDIRMNDSDAGGREVAFVSFSVAGVDKPTKTVSGEGKTDVRQTDGRGTKEKSSGSGSEPVKKDGRGKTESEQGTVPKGDKEPPKIMPTVSVAKPRYTPGEPIKISFTAPDSFSANAWVGIIPSSVPHGDETVNDKNKLGFEYLGKRTSGEITLKAPEKPGDYDVRLHNRDKDGKEVASTSFRVSKKK